MIDLLLKGKIYSVVLLGSVFNSYSIGLTQNRTAEVLRLGAYARPVDSPNADQKGPKGERYCYH